MTKGLGINGHSVEYVNRRYVCSICGTRLLGVMKFYERECPGPSPEAELFEAEPEPESCEERERAAWDKGYSAAVRDCSAWDSESPNPYM